MATSRTFDPAALERYQQFLGELLEELEGEIIPSLRDGTLKKAPAFGSAPGAYQNASEQYAEFHATTWRNLQYLRGTLHGMIAGLQSAIEDGGEVEAWVSSQMSILPQGDL
ncbi:hypothetical protein [Glycomyces buryatensis]|uniref:PE domain-containing protein n=1 Tax=Glycomyces buryatensis TaxID=2570927 RepID=A0A4S8QGX8_9ACTN|nr:hypothetical protein [Glycomyces buryatensis]THV42981.1 hypothetical protein FAB82_03235 [Glycomyces buryatensis]